MNAKMRAVPFLATLVAIGISVAHGAEAPTTPTIDRGLAPPTVVEARPTSATPLPRFDRWALQSRLRCSLPVIGAWAIDRRVEPKTKPPPKGEGPGLPQVILEQSPVEEPGFSRYNVIYQPARLDPANADEWYRLAASFYFSFQTQVKEAGQFETVEVSTPTVTAREGTRRFFMPYHLVASDGTHVSGGVVGMPVRGGVIFYQIGLQGHRPETIAGLLRELRAKATMGIRTYRRPVTPYLVATFVAAFALLLVVLLIRRRSCCSTGDDG
jgi:hypothetical protein